MRITKLPSYVARGMCGAILLVSVLTLRLAGPTYAAELQGGAPTTTATSLTVTRDGIAFF